MPVIAFNIVKIMLCSGILFGYYWIALRNKIFHQYNRFYLLTSLVLSLVLPFIRINIWQSEKATAGSIKLLKAVSGGNEYLDGIIVTARSNHFTTEQLVQICYLSISFILLTLLIKTLVKIRKLYNSHQHQITENIVLICTNAKGTPFSFLRYIFWNEHIDLSSTTGKQIFKHELAHVRQKHTHDKLFVNILLIFLWCNPFYWLIRKELNMIHEFIADKVAVGNHDTASFACMILQATYPQQHFQITNQFFYSPIKRRLLMLTKNNKARAGYISRLLVLPLLLLTFAAFSFKTKLTGGLQPLLYRGKTITVVVDAGHGGKDFGAMGANFYEKDIALATAKKIKAFNTNKDINIILTRETDIYQSPPEKASLANDLNPALFISIHLDKAEAGDELSSGMNVVIAKDQYSNTEKSRLFASAVINEFEGDYPLPVAANPRQMQKGIWILQEIKCPSVLIEAGYISNKKDLGYLQTDAVQENIAKNILAAIGKFGGAASGEATVIYPAQKQNNTGGLKANDTITATKVPGKQKTQ